MEETTTITEEQLFTDDVRETYPAVDRSFAEGWNDPKMDEYDHYEDFKRWASNKAPPVAHK